MSMPPTRVPGSPAPCPFCGSKASVEREPMMGKTFVCCSSCEARGPSYVYTGPSACEAAVKAWNDRP